MTNKKRFAVSAGLAYAVLVALLVLVMSGGVALAGFPIAGVGGFVVAADEIKGTDFMLYPYVGQTSEQQMYPMAAMDLASVTIKGLNLSKRLEAMGVKVDVVIKASGDVTGTNVKMKSTGLIADQAVLEGLDTSEHYSTDPLKKIDMKATSVTLTKPQINTHAMYVGSITIPGMAIEINIVT